MFNVCRVCMGSRSLSNIFLKHKSMLVSLKIMSLAQVQILPDDGLPSVICRECMKKLDKCYKFKRQCELSDHKLRLLAAKSLDVDSDSSEMTPLYDEKLLYPISNECFESDHLKTEEITPIGMEAEDNCDRNEIEVANDKPEDDHESCEADSFTNNIKIKKTQKDQCFTCGKVMSSRFRLKSHLLTHTGEKPFPCGHCDKKFSSAQTLKIHRRTHTGEKPLICSTCGAVFAHGAGLRAHVRKHTGEMPYHCTLCPRSFRTVGHLQYHVRGHTGEKKFECETCGRAFITRSDLNKHTLIHSGERPHVCTICGLALIRAAHLKRHMLTHNKPFPCDRCKSQFLRKSLLEKHKKKKHDNEVLLNENVPET